MSESLFPQIAKMLDVKIGEEFKCYSTYDFVTHRLKFENNGLYYALEMYAKDADGIEKILTNWVLCSTADKLLAKILSGEYEIIKIPWEPKENDKIYTFTLTNGKWNVCSVWWDKEPSDYALLDKGWVFRTREEANAALPAAAGEKGAGYEI